MKDDLPSFSFGDGPAMADALLALVIAGKKTATCGALREYRADRADLPVPGQRFAVTDGKGRPACVIEVTRVEIRRFCDIDAAFAFLEGEGDRSLEYWRAVHRDFFLRAGVFSEDMELVCEYFRVADTNQINDGKTSP